MALLPQFGDINPTAQKQTTSGNYLDFTSGAGNDFSQQYLPEIYEAEVERYGNRTLGGFLQMVGAEMPMTSDQVVWSEQNRLHIAYDACTFAGAGDATVNIEDSDGSIAAGKKHAIRANALIVLLDPATGTEQKAFVSAVDVDNGTIEAHPFGAADWDATLVAADPVKVFVYGSEFGKGTNGMSGSVEPSFTQFSNSPIIIKDKYGINGSDTAQIGWVEVATEDGTSGYLWYLKAESETRLRFQDYLEMAMVESKLATDTSGTVGSIGADIAGAKGTQGLFEAIETRGNVFGAFPADLDSFDTILKNLDGQGAIEENMLFLDRSTNLAFDDMLAGLDGNSTGSGSAYGVFENSQEMALNLGFTGFRRGSYDFYKTDWKYLNDASTRGAESNYPAAPAVGQDAIDGVIVPAGTSTVYDQILGTNIRRPFLHVRYRASEADDRRLKTWITGSVGGAYTSDEDAMNVHFLSERCLCVQGANNFVLLKSV